MAAQRGQGRLSARITVQMPEELRTQLNDLARMEGWPGLQEFLRDTLQARVDAGPLERDDTGALLRPLARDRQDITRQNEEILGLLQQLLEQARQLRETASVQNTDTMAILERLPDLKKDVADQTGAINRLTGHIDYQKDVINELAARIADQSGLITQLREQDATQDVPPPRRRRLLGI